MIRGFDVRTNFFNKEALAKANEEEIQSIIYHAIRGAGQIGVNAARESFQKKVKGAGSTRKWTKGKALYEQIHLIEDEPDCTVVISIMPDARLIWFEKGTKERFTKGKKIISEWTGNWKKVPNTIGIRNKLARDNSGHSTGRIEPVNFFELAMALSQDAMYAEIEKSVSTALKYILNRD